MQDRTFQRPTAELRVALFSNRANDSALHRACAELIAQLCHDALTETIYMAALCELGSGIESSESGFGFRVHGFDDKLLSLFEVVFRSLLSFRGRTAGDGLPQGIEDSRFNICKELLQRKYDNSGMDAPNMASSVRVRCVCPKSWSALQKV
jgi:nardilysin